MRWDKTKQEKPELFEDITQEELETQALTPFERPKEKAPPPKIGPQWEVEDSPATDFVKDFFKPI